MDKQKKKKSQKSTSKEPKKSKSKSKDISISANEKSIKSQKKQKTKTKEPKELVLEKSLSEISMIAPPVDILCELHRASFVYFCQTCEELVCNQCIAQGPHNNQYHRIIKMADAYKQRVLGMSECFRMNLIGKRDRLIQHLQKYQRQIQEVRGYKNTIERQIRSEYGKHLEKLKLSEGSKSALLLYQISTIQKQINGINDLGTKFFEMTNTTNIPEGEHPQKYICKFLLKSKQLYDAVEYYLNKPIRPFPDVDVGDLPNQLQIERQLLSLNPTTTAIINSFRNQVIWKLSNKQQLVKKDFAYKADSMIKNLSEQADVLNNRLRQFNMGCLFCGETMGDNVNGQCSVNFNNTQLTRQDVPKQFIGNGRHYFVVGSNEYLKKSIQI